jgi:uncharacterized protein
MQLPIPPADLAPAALLTFAAAFLAGLARGFSGFGAAMVFVPIVAAAVGPVVAMPVLLMTDLVTSSPLIARAFRACSWADVRQVSVGAVIGLPVGNHILTATDPLIVRWVVTALIALSLAGMISGWKWRAPQTAKVAAGVGLVSGLMSGLAQIGGPPVVMYWLSANTGHGRMRANLIAYFALLMWAGLAIFAFKGLLPVKVLWLAAAAAPGYALGMVLGSRLFGLASAGTFRWIAIGLVALATVLGMPILDGLLRGP